MSGGVFRYCHDKKNKNSINDAAYKKKISRYQLLGIFSCAYMGLSDSMIKVNLLLIV